MVNGPKGPLLLALVAFIVTFVTTRSITRLIRAGKGPFRNLSAGGTHLHHSTPGIVLLVAGAFTAVGASENRPFLFFGAALVGIGSSLVLDEFAMIFHLKDVYWEQEGQLSITVVTLAAACIGLAVVGVSPANVTGLTNDDEIARTGVATGLFIHLVLVSITALKGKYPTALLSIFLAPLAWFGAARLARPHSPWARRVYREAKTARAQRRAKTFDDRWYPVRRYWDHFIGGAPTATPAPAGQSETH